MTAPRARPCSSCPYRRDVPSGLWDAAEYARLRRYDGDTGEQAAAGAFGLFHCHQQPRHLCAGWVGCHDMHHNLAVRIHAAGLDLGAVIGYESPVPLFASGAEAAAHGERDIANPGPAARRKIRQLIGLVARRPPPA
jgi:hypothetical protein